MARIMNICTVLAAILAVGTCVPYGTIPSYGHVEPNHGGYGHQTGYGHGGHGQLHHQPEHAIKYPTHHEEHHYPTHHETVVHHVEVPVVKHVPVHVPVVHPVPVYVPVAPSHSYGHPQQHTGYGHQKTGY